MYEYKNTGRKIKKFFTLILLLIIVSATSILVYSMYMNIDINDYKIEQGASSATRLSRQGGKN